MLYASAHIVATNPNVRVNGKCFDELVPSSGQTTRRNGNFFRTKQCMIQQIYKYLFNFMLDRAWDFPWTPSPNIQIYVSKVWREKKQNETVASLHIHCYYFQQPWISDINCPCTKFRVYFNQLIRFRPLVVNNIFIFPWIRIGNDFFFFVSRTPLANRTIFRLFGTCVTVINFRIQWARLIDNLQLHFFL